MTSGTYLLRWVECHEGEIFEEPIITMAGGSDCPQKPPKLPRLADFTEVGDEIFRVGYP
jgi:hypothetical protein